MIGGSGSVSIHLPNGSGSGRTKDMWFRIRNTAKNKAFQVPYLLFRTRWEATGETVRIATCLPPRTVLPLELDERFPEAAPGRAVYLRPDKRTRLLCVRCREGWLAFEGIYYGKKKVMTPVDFNNGFLSKGKSQMFVLDTGT
jgi:hypothetical protein